MQTIRLSNTLVPFLLVASIQRGQLTQTFHEVTLTVFSLYCFPAGGTETTDAVASVGTMDSGSIQQMPTSAAHPLPVHFTAASHHVVHCSLAYIEPAEAAVGWTEEAVKDFISIMTTAESFQAVVVSLKTGGQVCIQAEIGNGNEDVADKLVAKGHASPRLPKV